MSQNLETTVAFIDYLKSLKGFVSSEAAPIPIGTKVKIRAKTKAIRRLKMYNYILSRLVAFVFFKFFIFHLLINYC